MPARVQGRLPQVFCCIVGDETVGLDLRGKSEKRSSGSLYSVLAGIVCLFSGYLVELGAGEK